VPMTHVRRLLAGPAAVLLLATGLAACGPDSGGASSGSRTAATAVPSAPSPTAAKSAPGAAALGDDPRASAAGRPTDTVDWITPSPKDARDYNESPDDCHQSRSSPALTRCVLGDRDGDVDVAVVGDSKTRQWVPALDIAAKKLGWRLVVSTKSTCAFTLARTSLDGPTTSSPSCDEWNRRQIARIQRTKPDIFINALYKMRGLSVGDKQATRTAMVEGVRQAVTQVAQSGAKVVLIDSSPIMDMSIPECVEKNPARLTRCTTPRDRAIGADRTWDAASVDRVLSGAPGSAAVDLDDYICPADRCAPVIGNVLVYRDKHHVTVPYVRTMAPVVLTKLQDVMTGGD
jgi:hypothetical protein